MLIQVYAVDENGFITGDPFEIEDYELGQRDDIPPVPPPTEGLHRPRWLNGEWTEGLTPEEIDAIKTGGKTLEQVKAEKIKELGDSCTAAIFEGFTSSALGEPHQYKCDDEAQRNFAGVSRLFDKGIITEIKWTTKDAGPLVHSGEQFNQLYLDAFSFVAQMQDKYRAYKEQVQAATSIDEINDIMNSITWEVTDGATTV